MTRALLDKVFQELRGLVYYRLLSEVHNVVAVGTAVQALQSTVMQGIKAKSFQVRWIYLERFSRQLRLWIINLSVLLVCYSSRLASVKTLFFFGWVGEGQVRGWVGVECSVYAIFSLPPNFPPFLEVAILLLHS